MTIYEIRKLLNDPDPATWERKRDAARMLLPPLLDVAELAESLIRRNDKLVLDNKFVLDNRQADIVCAMGLALGRLGDVDV